ncbi:hypothetical protein ILUMI_02093 [Ignelater luminosus]|uniref:Uncharacterized protein n=1 Tax=Ignelater luminosus TaxID=2038154 RepID=A0A8K0DH23_IGNLU|nr:hypothetical protein ILUMI_02093 [Ignelater luminosus]
MKAILWISVITLSISMGMTFSSEVCILKRNTANCRGENLTYIPLKFLTDKQFETLNLGANNFTDLNKLRLTNLQYKGDITRLLLDHNQIASLSYEFFADLPNVKLLDLSNNYITSIGEELCQMSNLEELILNGNPLKAISESAVRCLPKLLSIRLSNLPLNKLPELIFKDTNLIHIDLNGTNIENLNKIYFPKTVKVVPTQEPTVTTTEHGDYEDSQKTRNTSMYIAIGLLIVSSVLFAVAYVIYKRMYVRRILQVVSFGSEKERCSELNVTFKQVPDSDC